MKRILVIGATGQIGSELVPALRSKYGGENIIAVGSKTQPSPELKNSGPFEFADAANKEALDSLVKKYEVDTIYHLASLLSATGEKNPDSAWNLNMGSLKHVLDIARDRKLERVFWPSSIAAFGPTTPRDHTPQKTILEPSTMYGVTKVSGELLMNYYHSKYGLDTRSLRYPGLLSWKTPPGGGTTDYAVAIFYEAIRQKKYTSFLKQGSYLPMMYMPDAIRGTMQLMEAPPEKIKNRFSYNFSAISFAPEEVADEITKHIPDFTCDYVPDFRQKIADSWPKSIDDSEARMDWGWHHHYDLSKMSADMLENLQRVLK